MVTRAAQSDARIVYVFEEKLGLSVARNTGLRKARGAIIAYTDDDAEPYTDWLERIVHAFETAEPRPAIVAGEIEPVWGAPVPEWIGRDQQRMLSAHVGWSEVPTYLDLSKTFVCECNSAYRRDILERYGPWPEELGRVGSMLLSNENIINTFIFENEKYVYFDPSIRVRHHIHADRLTLEWMARRHFWQGVSFAIVEQKYGIVSMPGMPQISKKLFGTMHAPVDIFSNEASTEQIHDELVRYMFLGLFAQRNGLIRDIGEA